MDRVKQLCYRLANYYWSPQHPSNYVIPNSPSLGNIAHQDYGAFNLVWAAMQPSSPGEHVRAIIVFTRQIELNKQKIKGYELSTWLTLLNPLEFLAWYKENKKEIHPESRALIERALSAVFNISRIQ